MGVSGVRSRSRRRRCDLSQVAFRSSLINSLVEKRLPLGFDAGAAMCLT